MISIQMFQQYSNSIPSIFRHYSMTINDSPVLTIISLKTPMKIPENPLITLVSQRRSDHNLRPRPQHPQHRRPRVRALDCEMVGVGPRGKRSVLIRVSVVSRHGKAGVQGSWRQGFVARCLGVSISSWGYHKIDGLFHRTFHLKIG